MLLLYNFLRKSMVVDEKIYRAFRKFLIQLYFKQNPPEEFFIFIIYQNYTCNVTCTTQCNPEGFKMIYKQYTVFPSLLYVSHKKSFILHVHIQDLKYYMFHITVIKTIKIQLKLKIKIHNSKNNDLPFLYIDLNTFYTNDS